MAGGKWPVKALIREGHLADRVMDTEYLKSSATLWLRTASSDGMNSRRVCRDLKADSKLPASLPFIDN
jgi:hypothetical protein